MRIAIAALALLAGCATQQPVKYVWTKPGTTENDFLSDRGYCQAQAFGPTNVSVMQAVIIMNGCMQGKGWRLVPAS